MTSGEQWEWTFKFKARRRERQVQRLRHDPISAAIGQRGARPARAARDAGELIDDDKSVTFEVDTGVPAPTVTPEKTDNGGAFIEID